MRRPLALAALLAILGSLLAWRAYAEKYANCFPIGAGACVKIVIPAEAAAPPTACTLGELFIKTNSGGACTTGPCICICGATNTWTCK